jgi:hypothetical protein
MLQCTEQNSDWADTARWSLTRSFPLYVALLEA